MPRWDPEIVALRRQRVVEWTRDGLSAAQIARRLEITPRHVIRIRGNEGVAGSRPDLMTSDEIARAEEMLADGASLTEVARTLGRHVDTLWRRFPGCGWSSEQTGAYNSLRRLSSKLDI